jgi:CheY-like chemotaxis protein
VHGFCVQAGGVARLNSTPGLGTSVSLLLPASEGTDAASAPPPPAPAVAAPLVAGLRVLVVEDNDELGDATAALLRAHGAQVVRVAGADPALAHLHADTPFDVVLSDIVMPGEMDGYALAQWVRQHKPSLPVVLVSGYHQAPAKPQFRVLTEPCPQDELLGALRDAAMGVSGTPGTSNAPGAPGA